MSGFTTQYFDFNSYRLSFTGEILPSRREIVRDWLAANLSVIATSDDFRTSPKVHKHFVYEGAETPHLCVVIEQEKLTGGDDNFTSFDSEMKVVILGRFNATTSYSGGEPVYGGETEGEYLLDDIKRILYPLMLSEVNNTSGLRRIIMADRGLMFYGPTYFPKGQGELRVEFWVQMPSEGKEM